MCEFWTCEKGRLIKNRSQFIAAQKKINKSLTFVCSLKSQIISEHDKDHEDESNCLLSNTFIKQENYFDSSLNMNRFEGENGTMWLCEWKKIIKKILSR